MSDNQLQKFDKLQADITVAVQPIMGMTVLDKDSSVAATDAGRQVKSFLKRVEDLRKELVGPLNDEVKRINEYAKQITEPLTKAEGHVKVELLKYERILEQKRKEELARAEDERKRKEAEAKKKLDEERSALDLAGAFNEPAAVKHETAVAEATAVRRINEASSEHKARVDSISDMRVAGARKVWTFKVADAGLIPRELLILDEKAVRQMIAAGHRDIPGLEIFQETQMSIR